MAAGGQGRVWLQVRHGDPDLVARRRHEILEILGVDGLRLIQNLCEGCSYKQAAVRMHMNWARIDALRKRLARELGLPRQSEMNIVGFSWALVEIHVHLPPMKGGIG